MNFLTTCNNCEAAEMVPGDPRGYCAECIAETDGAGVELFSVRITKRVYDWIAGTELFQSPDANRHGYGNPGITLVINVNGTRARKDGSRTPKLAAAEAAVLFKLAGAMFHSTDDACFGDHDGLSDRRAARALIKNLGPAIR